MMSKSRSFWSSSHKLIYIALAFRFRVWPSYIYSLAHGMLRGVYSIRDEQILDSLLRKGIIYRIG